MLVACNTAWAQANSYTLALQWPHKEAQSLVSCREGVGGMSPDNPNISGFIHAVLLGLAPATAGCTTVEDRPQEEYSVFRELECSHVEEMSAG